jgi:cobalt-zinc-cadmium efflux system membrane fusion protein
VSRLRLAALGLAAAFAAAAPTQSTAGAEAVLTLDSSAAARTVELARVERRRLGGTIDVTATIEADANRVAHITSRIPARVVKLLADPGAQVTAGQPLVVLNSVELGKAKTDYLKARSLESIADQHLRREQGLYEQKIAARKDVLEARAAHDTALAQLQASRETLSLLIPADELGRLSWSGNGHPLSEFTLSSPIAGTLVRRDLTIGTLIDADSSPMTVIDLDQVWVIANIFEHDLAGVGLGAPARVTVEAYPDQHFDGTVRYIADTVDRETRTVKARIEVRNLDHQLKPGMFARAAIESARGGRELLVAPESAIYEVGGRKVAFVALGANRFVAHDVVVGSARGGAVEVISGLREGDNLVTRGGVTLKALLLKGAAK